MSSLSGVPQSPVLNEKLPELTALYDGALKAGAAGGPSVPLLHATGGMGVLSTSSPQSDMLDLDGVNRVGAGVLLKGSLSLIPLFLLGFTAYILLYMHDPRHFAVKM